MSQSPKPRRGMPRFLIYAMIPGGFLLLVLILILMGFWAQETSDAQSGTMQLPAPTEVPATEDTEAAVPPPAGALD
ncbi:MAG: hypothetical protein ACK4GT_12345 [Pararhodobacter sp.]